MNEKELSFDEFKEKLAEQMKDSLPEQYQDGMIEFHEFNKSGLGKMTGMTVRSDHSPMSPCLYIEPAYKDYQKYHLSADLVIGEIVKQFNNALDSIPQLAEERAIRSLIDSGFDWEKEKGSCMIRAVPVTGNEEYLAARPHRIQGDIAAVYQINFIREEDHTMSIGITSMMADQYGVTEDELFQLAVNNVMKMDPPHIGSLEDVSLNLITGERNPFEGTFPEEIAGLKESTDGPSVCVLTNESGINGAAMVFLPDVMDAVAEKLPNGFYILPSSRNEVMIVPRTDNVVNLAELTDTVRCINEIYVKPQNRLSDQVHAYDPKSKSLYIAGTDTPVKQQEQKMTVHGR